MEGNQKIYCTVETCKYNNEQNNECNLQTIKVTPTQNCNTQKQTNQNVQVMNMRKINELVNVPKGTVLFGIKCPKQYRPL